MFRTGSFSPKKSEDDDDEKEENLPAPSSLRSVITTDSSQQEPSADSPKALLADPEPPSSPTAADLDTYQAMKRAKSDKREVLRAKLQKSQTEREPVVMPTRSARGKASKSPKSKKKVKTEVNSAPEKREDNEELSASSTSSLGSVVRFGHPLSFLRFESERCS